MNKKTVIAATITTISLILIAVGMQAVEVARANPIPWCFNPQMTVTIQSPVNGANYGLPVLVSFTSQGDMQFSVSDNASQNYVRSFFYVLDGQNMATSGMRFAGTKTTEIYPEDPVYSYNFSGQAYLINLTDGLHNLTVYYGAVNNISYIGSPDEWIVYNHLSWQATSQFYVNSSLTPSPTPSPTPTLTPIPTQTQLTIDLANGNYMNNVVVGQPVYFSAVVNNGIPPYTYQWNYRPYYVGTDIGDLYPAGDTIQGATSQNFTFTPNSTGHYLITVRVWDSARAEGYFMSLPPGIWVNIEEATPTQAPSSTPSPTPRTSPIISPSPSAPEFPTWIVIPLILVSALLAIYKKRGNKQ